MHYLRARIGDRRPLLFVTCCARRSANTLSAIALIRIPSAVAVSASCVIIQSPRSRPIRRSSRREQPQAGRRTRSRARTHQRGGRRNCLQRT